MRRCSRGTRKGAYKIRSTRAEEPLLGDWVPHNVPPFAAGAGVQSTPGVASAALVGARASSWAFQFQGSSPYCTGGRVQPTTMAAPTRATPIAEGIIVVRPGRPRRRLAQKGRPSGGFEEATAWRRRRRHRTGRRRRMDGGADGRASPPQPCATASPAPAARRPPAQGPQQRLSKDFLGRRWLTNRSY